VEIGVGIGIGVGMRDSSIGRDKMYKSREKEPVPALLFNL